MHTDSPVFEVRDLSVSFATEMGWVQVVQDVSFSVARGRILGVVGESGSGKSVTCLAAMGLLDSRSSRVDPRSRVLLEGKDLLHMSQSHLRDVRGNRMSMIFQEPMTSLNPAFTVGNQVGEGPRIHRGMSARQAKRRAIDLLELVGIPDPQRTIYAYPHELSGGMRQRVMIAMAVACEPAVLIADEPTTALDVTVQAQILDLLGSMRDEFGLSILLITHDLGVIADMCDDVIVMYAGEVVERSDAGSVFTSPKHPYSEGLLAAMPRLGSDKGALGVIPGRVPSPWELSDGCRFAPRCPYALESCESPQELRELSEGHLTACGRIPEITLEGIRG